MLKALFKYGGVAAKTAAIRSKMLSNEEYHLLTQMTSVADVAAYLKNNTYYSEILKNVNERDLHRAELETILYNYFENVVAKLYGFVTGKEKKFLDVYFLRQEIKIMKDILIRIQAGLPYVEGYSESEFFKKNFSIDLDKLIRANTITEFIEVLKGTEYERILEPILNLKEHHNLFSILITLDIYYFKKVWQMKDKFLRKNDRLLITSTLGCEMDILNIMCIYRCKKYYNVANEMIYSYLLPVNYKLKKSTISQMVEANSVDDMLSAAEKTPYRSIFNRKEKDSIDINSENFIYKLYSSVIKKHPYSIANIIAQIHFIDIEVRNIINVIEGVRYKVPSDQIKRLIEH